MAGYVNLTFDDIKNLSTPELSILMYCTQKRMKNDADKLQIMGGGAIG